MKNLALMVSILCFSGSVLADTPTAVEDYYVAHALLAQAQLNRPSGETPEPDAVCPSNGHIQKSVLGFALSCMHGHWSFLTNPRPQ